MRFAIFIAAAAVLLVACGSSEEPVVPTADPNATATAVAGEIQAGVEATSAAREAIAAPTSVLPTLTSDQAGTVCPTPAPPTGAEIPGPGAGPLSGTLSHAPQVGGFIPQIADVSLQNFVAEADFTVPPGDAWDFGFAYRSDEFDSFEMILVYETPNPGWEQFGYDLLMLGGFDRLDEGEFDPGLASFDTSNCGTNNLRLEVRGSAGELYLNGQNVASFTSEAATGDVAVITGFFPGSQTEDGATHYENFTVESLE